MKSWCAIWAGTWAMEHLNPDLQYTFVALLAKCAAIEQKLKLLEDRVSVMEEQTISHENRLIDLEREDDDRST